VINNEHVSENRPLATNTTSGVFRGLTHPESKNNEKANINHEGRE